jgi:hypothetical protein
MKAGQSLSKTVWTSGQHMYQNDEVWVEKFHKYVLTHKLQPLNFAWPVLCA